VAMAPPSKSLPQSKRTLPADLARFAFDRLTPHRRLFTFVSLDKHGRPLPMPPLKVATDADRKKWEEGRARYERRRRQRAQLKKLKAAATKK